MGGGQRAMAPLEIRGEGPTYTLAPLEFWPSFYLTLMIICEKREIFFDG